MKQDPYDKMMALVGDTHWQTLAAATILEERMICSTSCRCLTSCQCSDSCWHSGSYQWRRSRSLGYPEDPQAERMDVNFHQWLPQVTPSQRGTIWEQTQLPSPTRQKCCVTFTEGRAPLLTEESPKHNARVDEALWLPLPMWQTGKAPHEEANWSRPGEVKGDEDLECLPPQKPHLKQLLGRKEPSPAGAEVGDDLAAPLMSTPKDLEPSPLHQSDWILWCIRHVPTLPWWKELVKIPSHNDYE